MPGPKTIRELKREILRLSSGSITPESITELVGLVGLFIFWEGEDAAILLYQHGKILARKKVKRETTPTSRH